MFNIYYTTIAIQADSKTQELYNPVNALSIFSIKLLSYYYVEIMKNTTHMHIYIHIHTHINVYTIYTYIYIASPLTNNPI